MEIENNLAASHKDEPADKGTFEELEKIANTIYNHVQFTIDTPSSNQEGMCQVLDLQLFVGVDVFIKYKLYENHVPASL